MNRSKQIRRRGTGVRGQKRRVRPGSWLLPPASYLHWGHTDRKGSVLLVVIGLLMLLMLVGITFFTFSTQENTAAEYYADASKNFSSGIDSDVFWDWALDQLILGPEETYQQSALWPGRHSLVPKALGMFDDTRQPIDQQLFNGIGVNVISGAGGAPVADPLFAGDPTNTSNFEHLRLHFGGAATMMPIASGGFGFSGTYPTITPNLDRAQILNTANYPTIDVGYSYPDINSAFLAYIGTEPQTGYRVITSSFHRPQYLRDPTTGAPIVKWYEDAAHGGLDATTIGRVMRPHRSHVNVADGVTPRFISSQTVVTVGSRTIQPFFLLDGGGNVIYNALNPGVRDDNLNTIYNEQGVWSDPTLPNNLELDADNDNDGTREGIWLDLNFPIQTLPDGRSYVPLFSFTVVEADGLFNVNLHGNLAGLIDLSHPVGANNTGVNRPVSRSNLGVSPNEVNPWWGLSADPQSLAFINPFDDIFTPARAAIAPLQQHRGFFGLSNLNVNQYGINRTELANMELMFLMTGRTKYDVTINAGAEVFAINDYSEGRWGERSALISGASQTVFLEDRNGNNTLDPGEDLNGNGVLDKYKLYNLSEDRNGNGFLDPGEDLNGNGVLDVFRFFSRAGQRFVDDDTDVLANAVDTDAMLSPLNLFLFPINNNKIPPVGHPLDNTGAGINIVTLQHEDANSNGILDAGEDLNGNGVLDYYLEDANRNGFLDPGEDINGNGAFDIFRVAWISRDPTNTLSAVRFRQYSGYGGGARYQGNFTGFSNYLSLKQDLNGQTDEADETIVDRRYQSLAIDPLTNSPSDRIFGPDEMAGLHLSTSDYAQALGSSRLRELLPFNFEMNLQARAIRQRFTTDSVDRREHGFTPNRLRPWEFNSNLANEWTAAGDYNADTRPSGPSLATQGEPGAEFPPRVFFAAGANAAGETDGRQPFRLALRAVIGSQIDGNTHLPSTSGSPYNRQLRHNINRLLTQDSSGFATYRHLTPHPDMLQAGDNLPIIGSPGNATAAPSTFNPGTSRGHQEYWARRDRQLMARDIYVMLYMLGGGEDNKNYATLSNADPGGGLPRPLFTDAQLQEMAQFAVNYVDALDRDNVITRFEYDKDLSDGWNLDDNPYTTATTTPVDPSLVVSGDRGEVFGVEAQMLTLSEALCIKQTKQMPPASDNTALTPYDDTTSDRYFTYIELQNVGAEPVQLRDPTNMSNQQWRIRLIRPPAVAAPDFSIIPQFNGGVIDNPATPSVDERHVIMPGANFTIGSVARGNNIGDGDTFTDGTTGMNAYRGADFRVDFDNPSDGRFNRLVPNIPDAGTLVNEDVPPATNLDLVHLRDWNNGRWLLVDHGSKYPLSGPNPQTGSNVVTPTYANPRGMFGGFVSTNGNISELLTFVLERRLNLNRTAASLTSADENNDNPWVIVDVLMDANGTNPPTIRDFALLDSDTATNVFARVQNLQSTERWRPLDRSVTGLHDAATVATSPYASSIGATVNQKTPQNEPHLLWQSHFDRDFTSVMELLSIPLYGPDVVTRNLASNGRLVSEFGTGVGFEARTAQAKFLRPVHPQNQPIATNAGLNNRWYRILELLEVPTRANKKVENSVTYTSPSNDFSLGELKRVPGKINLNGIRHPEVLMGLLDEPNMFSLLSEDANNNGVMDPGEDRNGNGLLDRYAQDIFEPATRDWYQQFLISRDAFDPYTMSVGTPLILPGSPASRPFRDFSQGTGAMDLSTAPNTVVPSLERGLLRRLMLDNADLNDNSTYERSETRTGAAAHGASNGNGTRRLFETRTAADLAPAVNVVDPHTRHRLLSKVANNSTNRSNVFLVWISVGFFDSYQPDPTKPDVVQIGAEMADQPRRRGFFVVDRTLLEDAYDVNTGTFNFRKFVQYRKTVQ